MLSDVGQCIQSSFAQIQCMGMRAVCCHGMVMVTSMAQLHKEVITSVMSLQRRRWGW